MNELVRPSAPQSGCAVTVRMPGMDDDLPARGNRPAASVAGAGQTGLETFKCWAYFRTTRRRRPVAKPERRPDHPKRGGFAACAASGARLPMRTASAPRYRRLPRTAWREREAPARAVIFAARRFAEVLW
jgi:hypothetical protein